ncbi:MAG: hypothetical protein JWN75_256 [Candidatus Saccharibacteria bacterium]|nr:hypothetical protein [Candidatus Saccharibacteria bacterium]
MTEVIVMGGRTDIMSEADLTATRVAVDEFLIGRGNYDVDITFDGKIVVTPHPREGVNRKQLAEQLREALTEQFAEQPA